MKKKTRNRTIVVSVLLLLLAAMLYFYFIMLESGGGLVSARKAKVGGIEFELAIYGPGRGMNPTFSRPMAVAVDNDKNIYVTDAENNRVCVFDRDGNFLFEFGARGVAWPATGEKASWKPGLFNYPYGITIDPDAKRLYVGDMGNRRIQIFDLKGKFIDYFPKDEIQMTKKNHAASLFPTAMSFRNGKLYVCNPYQIMIFDGNGKLLKDIGMPGTGNGEFDRPNGIDAGPDGTIYVSDSNNLRVQALTPEGKVKWVLGKKVEDAALPKKNPNRLWGLPRNLSVGPDGNVYVADAFDSQSKVISPDGKFAAKMGQRGVENGMFNMPNAVLVDNDKTLYVTDRENNRIQVVRFSGFAFETP